MRKGGKRASASVTYSVSWEEADRRQPWAWPSAAASSSRRAAAELSGFNCFAKCKVCELEKKVKGTRLDALRLVTTYRASSS